MANPEPGGPGGGRDLVRMATLVFLGIFGLACVALTLTVIGLMREGTRVVEQVGDVLGGNRPTPAPTIDTRAVIVERLTGATELTTAIYTLETVIDERQDRTFAGFTIGEDRLLYVAHGSVRAGVDVGRITPDDVDVVSDTLTIRLPPPELLDRKVDVEKSYVYELDGALFGRPDPDLQSRAERFALGKIVEAACEAGILEEANARAETVVQTLLGAGSTSGDVRRDVTVGGAAFREIRVVTRPPAPGACPTAAGTATPAGG